MRRKVPYRTTKLPTYFFDSAELVKSRILTERANMNQLPAELIRPEQCPICNESMDGLEVNTRVSYFQCEACGYKQPGLDIEAKGTNVARLAAALGIGVLASLGLAALLHILTRNTSKK